jgi:hypothetical protein
MCGPCIRIFGNNWHRDVEKRVTNKRICPGVGSEGTAIAAEKRYRGCNSLVEF